MDKYKKLYNETLEQAKKELATCGSMDCDAARQIFRLFPQLAESEDEKIRKTLIDALKISETIGELKFRLPEPTREEAIAWLEKQGQKPVEFPLKDKVFSIMRKLNSLNFMLKLGSNEERLVNEITSEVRDLADYSTDKPAEPSDEELVRHPPIAYTYPSDASRDEQLKMALLALLNSDLIKVAGNKFTKQDLIDWVEKQKEQKPSINIDQLKSLMLQYLQEAANEKDDSDIEADTDKWARKILEYDFEQKPAEWIKEDEEKLNLVIDYLQFPGPLMKYKLKDWLKSLPERFNLQPKQEWRKEDEENIGSIAARLDSILDCSNATEAIKITKEIVWLKSLRPQPKQELSEDVKKTLDEVSHILIGLNYKQVAKDYKQAIEKLIYSRPSWKPSKEQMTDLLRAEGRLRIEGESVLASKLAELYEQFKNLI